MTRWQEETGNDTSFFMTDQEDQEDDVGRGEVRRGEQEFPGGDLSFCTHTESQGKYFLSEFNI